MQAGSSRSSSSSRAAARGSKPQVHWRSRLAAAQPRCTGGSSGSSRGRSGGAVALQPCRAQAGGQFGDANALAGMFMAYAMQLQQQQQAQAQAQPLNNAATLTVDQLTFHPPGAEAPLLQDVSFTLPANQLGLIIGRSGSGKTTLLQLLSGLAEQNSGAVYVHKGPLPARLLSAAASSNGSGSVAPGAPAEQLPTSQEQRMRQVGLVFQFPERHFLGDNMMQELTFSWPKDMAFFAERQRLAVRLQQVVEAVGLQAVPFDIAPSALSGGQQRRLALALQLVRQPSVLLLDEPLAGLDWRSRAEVVQLLARLKEQCTLVVVSHDLREIAPLVDCAFRMQGGGRLEQVDWQAERGGGAL